jgi:D-methionine transport system substrate-binding protein
MIAQVELSKGDILSPSMIAKAPEAEKPDTVDPYEIGYVVITDYVQPNNVVESGEIDANYFQHTPYLDDFNKENGTHIVSVASIHVEPLGLYGGKQSSLDAIKN